MSSRAAEVRRIFAAACDLQGDAREACLQQQCGADVELRREVDALLRNDDQSDYLVEAGLAGLRRRLAGDAPMPERIGPYRLLGVLGRGGMGVVYRASQAQPARDVALKVLAPGVGGAAALQRFAFEAEALGRLQHSGIAQVYAVGNFEAGADGPPFLAMELVHGEPLHVWTAQAQPDLSTRLAVLLQIADAVHHAHQRGLIHRDLKPGNVFVDAHGRAKVLDFGIARLIDGGAEQTMLTRTGQLLGTLAYMSPEQASGESHRVDVRTDVYALGVLGYQLLSGELPIDVSRDPLTTGLRRVVEEEPRPLGVHERRLGGDLQTIFAKALRKEPERRYASMQAFADDLRRHLAHEPIQAQAATFGYLAARFVRRHRGLVAGAVLAVLALLAGSALSVTWALRADAAAGRAAVAEATANGEAQLANRVTTFVESLFSAAAPAVALGRDITAKDLVAKGAADIRSSLHDEPLLRARLSLFLGTVQSEMGETKAALPLVDEALSTLRRLLPADDLRIEQALLARARVLFVGRESLAARPLFAEALQLHEAAARPRDGEFARCHEGLGACALEALDLDAAQRHYELVSEVRRHDPNPAVQARDLVHLANVFNLRRDNARAEQLFTEAHALLQSADDPVLAASVATNLGVLRMSQQRPQEAEVLFREALVQGEKLLGPDHPQLLRRLCNLAGVLGALGRVDESEPLLVRALALGDRQGASADDGVANAALNLGNLRAQQGNLDEALQLFARAASIYERIGGANSPDLADALENQARVLELQGKSASAAQLQERVTKIRGQ